MKTRRKPGDVAIIVREEPGCDRNIGKIVEIRGPLRLSKTKGPQWLIRSANHGGHWYFRWFKGGLLARLRRGVRWDDEVDHPDAWLVPIIGRDSTARHGVRHNRAVPSSGVKRAALSVAPVRAVVRRAACR
jgi:hypothetical protein